MFSDESRFLHHQDGGMRVCHLAVEMTVSQDSFAVVLLILFMSEEEFVMVA